MERKSPTTLVITRSFAAPPERVFAAHTDPAIVKRWMLGPDGWSMPVCELDARPGGKMRMEWKNDENGASFSLTGEYQVVEAPHRIVHTERMHLPDPTPENRVETRFEKDGRGTRMTMT
ncbi:MAG TPA: SRPBCC domain-containing protein, partial [Planctomycetota bacterium]|nr:SRPBCC domain-containing protein [Planctomycetota bacterium]